MKNTKKIDPHALHQVATKCRKLQTDLDHQVSLCAIIVIEFDHALKGHAVVGIKERFEFWLRQLKKLSCEFGETASKLELLAQLADDGIEGLHKLDHLDL